MSFTVKKQGDVVVVDVEGQLIVGNRQELKQKVLDELEKGERRFLVDFAGGDLAYYVNDPSGVEVVASTTSGKILRTSISANNHIEGLRAMFDVSVESGQTADLRLFLRAGSRTLTETWTYPWTSP